MSQASPSSSPVLQSPSPEPSPSPSSSPTTTTTTTNESTTTTTRPTTTDPRTTTTREPTTTTLPPTTEPTTTNPPVTTTTDRPTTTNPDNDPTTNPPGGTRTTDPPRGGSATTTPLLPGTTASISPSPSSRPRTDVGSDGSGGGGLGSGGVIGISVAAVCVVLAVLGIYLFRKLKLKPSSEFKSRVENLYAPSPTSNPHSSFTPSSHNPARTSYLAPLSEDSTSSQPFPVRTGYTPEPQPLYSQHAQYAAAGGVMTPAGYMHPGAYDHSQQQGWEGYEMYEYPTQGGAYVHDPNTGLTTFVADANIPTTGAPGGGVYDHRNSSVVDMNSLGYDPIYAAQYGAQYGNGAATSDVGSSTIVKEAVNRNGYYGGGNGGGAGPLSDVGSGTVLRGEGGLGIPAPTPAPPSPSHLAVDGGARQGR
ncbi:hypothetical protein HK097_001432 [Rhizophlyctis rosea]|uniref:Uncharacterized protein n=1 Tax=Rhizophlyctis rosea TaxID=64517 RepID=A0AAD5X1Y1_9FUNG|nr:hypothetical protein HK097_001432 [Rhizophlyctis rosea]